MFFTRKNAVFMRLLAFRKRLILFSERSFTMSVLTITKSNFEETVLKSDKPVLLDFWASWCGPCRMQGPIIDQLAASHSNVVFGKVNVDEEPDLASEYGITSIPTLIIFRDGRVIDQVTGVTSKASIERMLGL